MDNKHNRYSEILFENLLDVELPGRYVGGEFGVTKPYVPGMLSVGICFPDLYEIGMSNTAVKILYDITNSIENCSAQRVFAPAPDFSRVLTQRNIPLYTLESEIPLLELDILAVTIGYELSATNILSVLDHGNIPLRSEDRGDTDPIVIAGGPVTANPEPFETFFDAFYIGEAEYALPELLSGLEKIKSSGGSRKDMLEWMYSLDYVYHQGKEYTARCIDTQRIFSKDIPSYFTVPSIKTVQDHGAVEIMRGCPNGCRFCHAGIIYRPYRQANAAEVFNRVDHFVFTQGYDNITLSSLSTGDYPKLSEMVKGLDAVYGKGGVSFGLPSLKIDSFTLHLLEEVSKVRKSGLTFAVETPTEAAQRGINKTVPLGKVLEILREAKERGWKLAKFYFMIGLPGTDPKNAAKDIIEYIHYVEHSAKIQLNVNIGTCIPKPHTPFQWSRQLTEEESLEIFQEIKQAFRKHPYVKVTYHDPFISALEGVISRGDKRVGDLIENAYRSGAVLDAWGDHLKKDVWRDVFDGSSWDVIGESLSERDIHEPLPWDKIDIGTSKGFLQREYEKTLKGEMSPICDTRCKNHCGVCNPSKVLPLKSLMCDIEKLKSYYQEKHQEYFEVSGSPQKVLLKFSKKDKAKFFSHINIMGIFERTFRRAEIPVSYTQGYNPKPKIDFAHPLSLGVESDGEYLMFHTEMDKEILEVRLRNLCTYLPSGITVTDVKYINIEGKFSLMAQYGGAQYYLHTKEPQDIEEMIKQADHAEIQSRDAHGVVIRLQITEGKRDLFKLTDDKYGFIKKYRPKRLETFSKEQLPMNQSSFLA